MSGCCGGGWPGGGGGGVPTEYTQQITAAQCSTPALTLAGRAQRTEPTAEQSQDSIYMPELGALNANFVLHPDFRFATPGFNLIMAWQEQENGASGVDHEFKAGIIIYENDRDVDINYPAATATADKGTADDHIIITNLTTNLELTVDPDPLTTAPFWGHLWLTRESGGSGECYIHSFQITYNIN